MVPGALFHFSWLKIPANRIDFLTFVFSAAIVLVGAVNVVRQRNPVLAALSLVMTLFGVAVLFVEQQANFLAAVQIIVYAGAIVVLFLFVIMFLGVDREESISEEPLRGQRFWAYLLMALTFVGLLLAGLGSRFGSGVPSVAGTLNDNPAHPRSATPDVVVLGKSVFTTYLFAFEITSALLVIAVVGAVVLARRPGAGPLAEEDDDEVEVEVETAEPEEVST
jgi:NADH-quinone oxidoreductase subunit J